MDVGVGVFVLWECCIYRLCGGLSGVWFVVGCCLWCDGLVVELCVVLCVVLDLVWCGVLHGLLHGVLNGVLNGVLHGVLLG